MKKAKDKAVGESVGFLMADVSRLMRKSFEELLEGSSLTLAQARALFYLSRQEGIRQVVLAEILEVQPITLARLIDQLQAEGLVERRPDPNDRRAYQLFLTKKAQPHLDAIESVTAMLRPVVLDDVTAAEAEITIATLNKMRLNLSKR